MFIVMNKKYIKKTTITLSNYENENATYTKAVKI